MKTLRHHKLIFDEDCPLCGAYTKAFIKTKMLDINGREAYQNMHPDTCSLIDKSRARNEIALVNTKTGEVIYGVESLIRVLGHAWPIFNPLFKINSFKWWLKKFYSFISYNRKVIIPARENENACNPDFNLKYRILYLIVSWLITSVLLNTYSTLLIGVIPPSNFFREFIICGGQIIFQFTILSILVSTKRMDYLGNMMSISLAGALCLGVIYLFSYLFNYYNSVLYCILFLIVAGLMFIEHLRRMRLLKIGFTASMTWVLYRVLVLIILLNLK